MGVVSVRLNKDEESILKKLSDYYHADKSSLIKRSLFEFYENMVALEVVKQFEVKENRGEISFHSAEVPHSGKR